MGSDPRIINIDPDRPQKELIKKAACIIRENGTVIFPTKCLYGLAADAYNPGAVEKIFNVKERPADNPLLVLIHSKGDLNRVVKSVPARAKTLMDRFWPGDVTLVMTASGFLPDLLTAGTGKIGVRLPGHPVAKALVKQVGGPITGTSANISGMPGCASVKDLDPKLVQGVDLVLDAGSLKKGKSSTVVDLTTTMPTVLREGRISAEAILEIL